MIRSFRGKFAETILHGRAVPKGFSVALAKVARRKLVQLNNAGALNDLAIPPGNRLEALKGNLAGKWSIRINHQWRIVFRWTNAGPDEVEIVDYYDVDDHRRGLTMARRLPPIHPGEVLREEFLVPMKLTPYALARACGVPRTRIERLAREETPVTADTALRLARYFGTTAEFWMGMQAQYDLERAQDAAAAALRRIKPRERDAA
jgi:addiction module HigA family antidote